MFPDAGAEPAFDGSEQRASVLPRSIGHSSGSPRGAHEAGTRGSARAVRHTR